MKKLLPILALVSLFVASKANAEEPATRYGVAWEYQVHGPNLAGTVVEIYKSTDPTMNVNLPPIHSSTKWSCHQFPAKLQKATGYLEGAILCVHSSGATTGVYGYCDPKKSGWTDRKVAMVGEGDYAGLITVTCRVQ